MSTWHVKVLRDVELSKRNQGRIRPRRSTGVRRPTATCLGLEHYYGLAAADHDIENRNLTGSGKGKRRIGWEYTRDFTHSESHFARLRPRTGDASPDSVIQFPARNVSFGVRAKDYWTWHCDGALIGRLGFLRLAAVSSFILRYQRLFFPSMFYIRLARLRIYPMLWRCWDAVHKVACLSSPTLPSGWTWMEGIWGLQGFDSAALQICTPRRGPAQCGWGFHITSHAPGRGRLLVINFSCLYW